MLKWKKFIYVIIALLFLLPSFVMAENVNKEYNYTTGKIFGFPGIRVTFEVSDDDIAEVFKSKTGEFRVRFKRPGDVYVRTTFYYVDGSTDTELYLFHVTGNAVDDLAINRDNFAQEILDLVNEERNKHKLNPLKLAKDLNKYADIRAKECIKQFSHTRPNGKDGVSIIPKNYKQVGENLSAGSTSPKMVMEQWMNSPTHRDNILYPDYEELGVGYAYSSDSRYRHYWVQLFRL